MTVQLLIAAGAGLATLLLCILWLRLHAFVALLIASALIGLGSGMTADALLASMQAGMGSTLGFLGIVVGLGAMIGKLLEVTNGAEALARRVLAWCGPERSVWALGVCGFVVAIPVFFDVGLVVLAPLVYGLAQQTGKPIMRFALPLLAGLAAAHAFVPPTPGPTLVSHELGADLGQVAALGLLVGLPSAVAAGVYYGRWISTRVPGTAGLTAIGAEASSSTPSAKVAPALGAIVTVLLLPLALLSLASYLPHLRTPDAPDSPWLAVGRFVGHPFIALLLTTLLAFELLGRRSGLSRHEVSIVATAALEPVGTVLLVTGAGGVLKQVLVDSRAGEVLARALADSALPLLLLCFAFAATVRVLQGSATVAMVAAAGFLAPLLGELSPDPTTRALCVLCIAAGATFMSHVNDSGFWLVSRYFGLDVSQTLRTWSAATSILGLSSLALCLLLQVLLQ